MSVSISGILLDPFGQPASFAEVKFITWQGANDVLTTAPAVFKTSADGAYSFAVEFATYTVQVRYNQSNGKFQTIKQKVIVNSNTIASTLGELLLFNEPLTPPEIAYVEQLVAEAEGYRDEAGGFSQASEASSQASEGFSQDSSGYAQDSAESAQVAADLVASIAPVPLNGGVWASGQTYTAYNEYMIYNGEAYSPRPETTLPYTVGATPDLSFTYQVKLNDHSLLAGLNPADGSAHNYDDIGSLLGGTLADAISYVTPEQFGQVSGDDSQLFIDAISSGLPVMALGPIYNVSKVVSTSPAVIIFGRNTRVVNWQSSGPKEPSFLFEGSKDSVEIDVLSISSDYLKDTITVADASGFSVGDTVLLQENEPLVPEIDYGQGALFQDANYREFSTILAINGNDITFEEYLRFPYQTANSLKLQKINFLEDVHVAGGIFEGGNGGGGGVTLNLCRYSSVTQVKGRGLSELDRNGGSVCKFEECWESHRDAHDSKWTLFGAHSVKNQSCTFGTMQSKRTSNGGLIVSGDRFCSFATVVQDSTGDDNGDGVGLSNGARNNSFGTINCSGSRCYGMWWHPTCDDNTVESFSSDVGITLALYLFGDRNKFGIVKGRNHPSGVAIFGNDNEIISGDVVTEGTALLLSADDTSGNKIQGQFISTGASASSYDLVIGNVVNTSVNIRGGARGINYAAGKTPNHDNTIFIDGPNPYVLAIDKHTKGYTWSNREINVNATARDLQVPVQGQPQGLGALGSTVSGDAAKVYRISIKTESTIADTYSEYYVINRQNVMQITPLIEGVSAFAARLSLSGNIVQIATNGGGNISMTVNVDQY